MKSPLWKRLSMHLPFVGAYIRRVAEYERFVRHGHFYSPCISLDELRAREMELFAPGRRELPGIDLREAEQLALLVELGGLARGHEPPATRMPGRRYCSSNDYYGLLDGLVLMAMLQRERPRRIVEVGSGYSSALMLDMRPEPLDARTRFTFIEPYPERLHALLSADDRASVRIIERSVQHADPAVFNEMEAGDFLLIDSSHVSRIGSDVNYLFFEVVPRLPAGVLIHVHDVFYPFEYPRDWAMAGRYWNEAYLLRALLVGNAGLRVELFTHMLQVLHPAALAAAFPGTERERGGAIYLRRT